MKDVQAFQHLGGRRYRENRGVFYDEFEVGDIIEHRPGRTVTETDNVWQSLLALNNHPLHIDHAYARTTEFGRPLVSSLVTLSIVGGMSTNGTSAKAIANLGWESIRLPNPVFVGDTLYAETEVVAMRPSRSRPTAGIVTFETKGLKDDGTLVVVFTRSALIPLGGGIDPA
ncbi:MULTISPECIES: MaoC family dehydratase [Streptosporangium]|uniref:Itaconyl-CoA hydratase n=1 Tax=Streptosporangium brasiliense TaxID=47480 RepID=A0ABT9REG7_9ACTN|nr:MaoC family dehydratase [Streptosporangium brasiliense]MDP9867672.1 itaconyl-CoA hydratase [Streptosporangium brasiliense]